jgi:hypothetical protein
MFEDFHDVLEFHYELYYFCHISMIRNDSAADPVPGEKKRVRIFLG